MVGVGGTSCDGHDDDAHCRMMSFSDECWFNTDSILEHEPSHQLGWSDCSSHQPVLAGQSGHQRLLRVN